MGNIIVLVFFMSFYVLSCFSGGLLLRWDLDRSELWFHITSHPLHSASCHTSQGKRPPSCPGALSLCAPQGARLVWCPESECSVSDAAADVYVHSADFRNSDWQEKKWERRTKWFQMLLVLLKSIVIVIDSDWCFFLANTLATHPKCLSGSFWSPPRPKWHHCSHS